MITLFGSEEIEPLGPVDLLRWFTDWTDPSWRIRATRTTFVPWVED